MGFNRNFTLTLQSSDMAYWKLQYQPFSSMMGTQHQKLHSLRGFPRYQKFFIKVHKAGIGRYIISQILSHHSLSYQKKKYITYHLLLMMASFWGCSMTLKKSCAPRCAGSAWASSKSWTTSTHLAGCWPILFLFLKHGFLKHGVRWCCHVFYMCFFETRFYFCLHLDLHGYKML